MNRPLHHVVERRVNKAVACQRRMAAKPLGHDANRKMPAAFAGAYMPDVQVRVVLHLDLARRQCLQKPGADQGRAISGHLLSAVFNDRTNHRPCKRPKTSVSPVSPNSLKYTQADSLNV